MPHFLLHQEATLFFTEQLLAEWLLSAKSADQSLYADIPSEKWNSVDKIFQSTCRPDLVLVDKLNISILELTICRETNLEKSKQYKLSKYQNIHDHIQPHLRNYSVKTFTIEVSTLGFISNYRDFIKSMNLPKLSKSIMHTIIQSVLKSSHNIYCFRNSA